MPNGSIAIGTTRGEEMMVVFVTIWTPIPLKKTCVAQLRFTRHAYKVLGVPHLTQCCDHLHNDNNNNDNNDNNNSNNKGRTWRMYHITAHMRIMVPFPQCICCMKHSGPLLWCARQSSPDQSSDLPADHR